MTGPLRVAGWWGLAALLAWLCTASLVDRLARQGVLVGAPPVLAFGGDARAARASEAWQAGDLNEASRLSRAAVARRPIDAATLRLAGSIALARGEEASAEALMRLAGAGGWRDRETQLYWGEVAARQGAWEVAVQRAEALGRAGEGPDLRRLLRRIEAAPAGRAALVRRWRQGGDWLVAGLATWPGDDPRAMANRYATVMAVHPWLTPADRARLTTALVPDRVDWAFAILAPDERRLVFAPEGQVSPLGWNVSAAPGIEATADGAGGLYVGASGPALLPLADRLLRLAPGTARLDLRVEGARSDLPLVAALECVKGQVASATPGQMSRGRFSFDLVVPPGCRPQRLRLAVTGEEARRGADFRLFPPTLTPAARAP